MTFRRFDVSLVPMPRRLFTSARVFPAVIAITLAIALLPERWLGWTSVPAEIVGLPFGPFGDGLNRTGDWLRPPPPTAGSRITSPEEVARLADDLELFRRLLFQEQAKNEELRTRIQQLESGGMEVSTSGVKKLTAAVVVRSPGQPFGSVILNRGSNQGVSMPAVAMYFGQILGRMVDVSEVQCTLLPLANQQNSWITAVIRSKDKPPASLETLPTTLQFKPVRDGTLIADVDKAYVIVAGDIALLRDGAWPRAAQGARIGIVESVRIKDADPLRNVVTVRPQHQVAQVTYVTLLIDIEEPATADNNTRDSGAAP